MAYEVAGVVVAVGDAESLESTELLVPLRDFHDEAFEGWIEIVFVCGFRIIGVAIEGRLEILLPFEYCAWVLKGAYNAIRLTDLERLYL